MYHMKKLLIFSFSLFLMNAAVPISNANSAVNDAFLDTKITSQSHKPQTALSPVVVAEFASGVIGDVTKYHNGMYRLKKGGAKGVRSKPSSYNYKKHLKPVKYMNGLPIDCRGKTPQQLQLPLYRNCR
jgi:hypothetical protein